MSHLDNFLIFIVGAKYQRIFIAKREARVGGLKTKEEKIAFRVVVLRRLMLFEIQALTMAVHKGTRSKEMQKMLDWAILHFVHRNSCSE